MLGLFIGSAVLGIGVSGVLMTNSEAYGLVTLAGGIIWSAHLLVERREL